jgi:hypothetical protein
MQQSDAHDWSSFAISVGLFNLQQQSNKENGPEILVAKLHTLRMRPGFWWTLWNDAVLGGLNVASFPLPVFP